MFGYSVSVLIYDSLIVSAWGAGSATFYGKNGLLFEVMLCIFEFLLLPGLVGVVLRHLRVVTPLFFKPIYNIKVVVVFL